MKIMKHLNLNSLNLLLLLFFSSGIMAQDLSLLPDPGKAYRKQTRKQAPPVKTKYHFGVGAVSGREYLMQQDLLDPKGKYKSSGVFSEEGNKSADIRYTYDAAGLLTRKETRYIGKNLKDVLIYNASGKPEKLETRTKGDTLIGYTSYLYDAKGFPSEEHDFRGEKLIRKRIFEDTRSDKGQLLQTCHYELDSTGARVPGNFPLTVNEYDDAGVILQTTVYNNKEKRKMLSWVYYKYQLDNDYKIIRRSGYNEEQLEISRTELTYTDSSIQATLFKSCGCAAKTSEMLGAFESVFNEYGEVVREIHKDAKGELAKTVTRRFDEFGHQTEEQTVLAATPEKLIKTKSIIEFHLETSANNAKPKK
jgi:hypothetical protein